MSHLGPGTTCELRSSPKLKTQCKDLYGSVETNPRWGWCQVWTNKLWSLHLKLVKWLHTAFQYVSQCQYYLVCFFLLLGFISAWYLLVLSFPRILMEKFRFKFGIYIAVNDTRQIWVLFFKSLFQKAVWAVQVLKKDSWPGELQWETKVAISPAHRALQCVSVPNFSFLV